MKNLAFNRHFLIQSLHTTNLPFFELFLTVCENYSANQLSLPLSKREKLKKRKQAWALYLVQSSRLDLQKDFWID